MGVMCEMFGLTPRAIRHYEERGLVHPKRDAVNRRVFNPKDRARIGLIALLRRADLGIEDIADLLQEDNLDDLTRAAMDLLHARRQRLQDQLAAVGDVIAILEAR
jgi:DNA-binding transcriptional MerR regulator